MTTSVQGHFLVASNHLRDPNFYRSVILMLEHNDQTAMGLVINRPSSIAVDAAITELGKQPIGTDPIFAGGPVETSALFILHGCSDLAGNDEEVVPGIYVTGSNDSFDALVTDGVTCQNSCKFRIYCGYAGWGPGQLEAEIGRGDWRSLPGESRIVFDEDPYTVWEICTQQLQEASRFLPHIVRNPEWN